MNQVATVEQHELQPASNTVADRFLQIVERVSLSPDIDVSKMEAILNMQMRVLERQAEDAFNDALVAAQAEIAAHPVIRNRHNDQTNSNYADLKAVNDVAVPIAAKHGINLSFTPEPFETEGWIKLGYKMSGHGHTRSGSVPFPLDSAGIAGKVNKTAIHAAKSAYTYAQRTLVCLLFNIATTDDDGNGAGGGFVTEEQVEQLEKLITETKANRASFLKYLGVEDLNELPAAKFNRAVRQLERRKQQGVKS